MLKETSHMIPEAHLFLMVTLAGRSVCGANYKKQFSTSCRYYCSAIKTASADFGHGLSRPEYIYIL